MKLFIGLVVIIITSNYLPANNADKLVIQENNRDTLNVGYTYWWAQGGPFIGLCGDEYALVFTGTVTKLFTPLPNNPDDAVRSSQKGVIKISSIRKSRATEKDNYNNEQYFSSDCFYDSGLKEGDKVIVFMYEYEGGYSIPGKSILKIKNFNDPIVVSIEEYIKNGQDIRAIKKDFKMWEKYGFKAELKEMMECMQYKKATK
ncbi:MAG: hypothetical protein IPJ81_00850 [Chitinophagaceae bacterium]|nr:hypothetical protein [Chitinophagaceae bacterium]